MTGRWVRLATTVTIVLLVATVISCAGSLPVGAPALIFAPLAPTPTPTESRPVVADVSSVYIGGMHSGHTVYSDGRMEYPGEFYSEFKQYWDWVATTDHDFLTSAEEWQSMIANADANNSKDFVSLVGYEWTSSTWGHMSVVFKGEPPSRVSSPPSASDPTYDSPRKLYDFLAAAGGLAAFAHPALPRLHIDFNRASDYKNDAIACLAGMFGFGGRTHWNATWDYADGRSIPLQSTDNIYAGSWIKTALELGYHLGFVGEQDMHEKTIPPTSYRYTGVVADELTREGVFEALKQRHTYAVKSPSGPGKKVLLRADAGNHLMGDAFSQQSNTIRVTLQGETDLDRFTLINLFVNGRIEQTRAVSGDEFVEDFSFPLAAGENYTFFEVRALSADDQMSQAFTSPMYVSAGLPPKR